MIDTYFLSTDFKFFLLTTKAKILSLFPNRARFDVFQLNIKLCTKVFKNRKRQGGSDWRFSALFLLIFELFIQKSE